MTPMLRDDPALLALMLQDAARQSELYRPGSYWRRKARNTADQIRRYGIGDFRGASSTIGLSFSDAVYLDVRHDLRGGARSLLRVLLSRVFPFKTVFDTQVTLTRAHEAQARRLRSLIVGANPRVRNLVERYTVPPSLMGGCLDYAEVNGGRIANFYLKSLHQHDVIAQDLPFGEVESLFEIGGGFGAHVHCLVENYPRLKKILYLDIPPNLYIGTQYLRALYGAAVIDYGQTRASPVIEFSANDELEIIAIAPWQIERLRLSVDVFYNAHSFVEMPAQVVANYARHLAALPGFPRTRVVMLTYTGFDLRTTLDPESLPAFFPTKKFDRQEFSTLDGTHDEICFVSRIGS